MTAAVVESPRAPAARIRSTERFAEWRAGRATVDRGLFRRQYNAVRFRELSSLWPLGSFRTAVAELAAKFIRDYEAKGYRLLTPLGDLLVFGPYQPRDLGAMLSSTPKSMQARVLGQGDDPFPDKADVVIKGEFLIPHTFTNDRWEVEG